MSTEYHIYANSGRGDPINFSAPAATVNGLTWTSSTLSYPGAWSFNARAFDTVSGLEEQNVDCSVTIVLDASGQDITNVPLAPAGIRAFALAGALVRVEWLYPIVNRAKTPAGFHVYVGTGGEPNYSSSAATVAFSTGIANTFVSTLTGLTDGTAYTIGVRAYSATGEEPNTNTVVVTADATGPTAVDSLTAVATAQS
jgi:hypothetical protein